MTDHEVETRRHVGLGQSVAVVGTVIAWVMRHITLASGDYQRTLVGALVLAGLAFGCALYELIVRAQWGSRVIMFGCMAVDAMVAAGALERLGVL